MNSRSARNEIVPNSSVAPTGPDTHASQNNTVPSHNDRRSRVRRSRCSLSSVPRSA